MRKIVLDKKKHTSSKNRGKSRQFPGKYRQRPAKQIVLQKKRRHFQKRKMQKALLAFAGMAQGALHRWRFGLAGEILGGLLGRRPVLPQFALPLGISFFTFQQIGYLVDTCRGTQFRPSSKSKQFRRRITTGGAFVL